MTTFTAKEILDAGEMFRAVSCKSRDVVTGLMIGINLAGDEKTLPDMVQIAKTMQNVPEKIA